MANLHWRTGKLRSALPCKFGIDLFPTRLLEVRSGMGALSDLDSSGQGVVDRHYPNKARGKE